MRRPSADAPEGATPRSLHEQLIAGIRERIVSGALREGAKVPEGALCAAFGVSRTPLREALKALAVEGFVELVPNRGAVVVPLDPTRLAEVFEAKGGLEHFIGLHAARRITDAEIAALDALHRALHDACARADAQGYTALNERIHADLAAAARNELICDIYKRLQTNILRARLLVNVDQVRMEQSLREHDAIMAALRARARLDLAERLEEHNATTGAAILLALSAPTASPSS